MAQHAILRFEKHKGNPARPLEAHHERQKEQYASNPDIDTSRSKYNFHIVKPEGRYYHFIQSRIEQAGCRTRKDSTRFVDTLITASPEFFKGKSPKEIQAFFQRAAEFLTHRVGRENIVSAVVHMDEKTPHLHLTFVPLTKDNRLCAKEIIGNRANLTKWQDDFHAYMVEKYPDLERGESASKTGRKHIPTRLFKQAVSLSKQARAIEAALDGINPLNAGKKKEEALSMLKKWFPQMENFSGQLKKYKVTINDLLAENEQLEARAKASEKGKMKDTMERAKLKSELDNLQRLVDRIPPDILAELKRQQRHTVKETYIGHTIHYRETNISFKNKRRVRKPQSEWVRVENTQEPIISEQVFRQVQEQIANRRRKCKDGTTQIFSGLVKCADCGWSLSYGENRQNSKPYGHYHCSKYGQGTRQCSMHYIRYDVLYAYVLSRLQYWSGLVQHDEERLLKRLLNANDKGQAAARKKQAAELKKAEKRKSEVDTLFARMYEDWAAGRITEYNFSMLSGKYQSEQAELDEKIEQLQSAIATESQNAADAEKWIALMKECVNPTELTAELLNTLIEKIVVHEAVKGEDGSREQEVEIFYRFIGKID